MKAGQFETCFIIQTYNRLSRSLSHRGAIVHTRLPEISVRFLRLSRRRNFNLGGQRRHACYFRGRCNNDSMWKFNHLDRVAMIYKIHDNIKRVEGEKRIPQWTFYFFEKAILNGCRVRAYFILLPGILYYLSIEKLENLKFRHSKVWIKYLDWTFFRCDKNISSSETRRRISSNFVHHLKLNRLISRYRVRIIYICLAEYIYIHTR